MWPFQNQNCLNQGRPCPLSSTIVIYVQFLQIHLAFVSVSLTALVCLPGVVSMASRVYAVGGFNSSLRERTVDVYDGASDQWSAVASMQERRSTLGAAVLGDLLYAVGGFNGSIGTDYNTHTGMFQGCSRGIHSK